MLPIELPFPFGRLGRPLAALALGALAVGAAAAFRHLRAAGPGRRPHFDAEGSVVRHTVVESDGPERQPETLRVPW